MLLKKEEQMKKTFTIYALLNNVTNKVYIGCTSNLIRRMYRHKYAGRNEIKINDLYRDWNESIECKVLEVLSDIDLSTVAEIEKKYIAIYKANDPVFGYNRTTGGEGFNKAGYSMSEEAKEKISKANTGLKRSDKTKKIMSECASNRSEETRRKMSEGAKAMWARLKANKEAA